MCSRQYFLAILVFATVAGITNGFSLSHRTKPQIISSLPKHQSSKNANLQMSKTFDWPIHATSNVNGGDLSEAKGIGISVLGFCSALAWIAISVTALSYHPDPKFADCTMRHNVLTMSQAFAFPLPVGFAAVSSCSSSDPALRLIMSLALPVASIWLAGASLLAPKFAFGYDLYSPSLKIASGLIHLVTAVASLVQFWKTTKATTEHQPVPTDRDPKISIASKLWGICSLGLLWFAICPVFAPYPLATVPTILGKRLSRPASAFTFLGAALAFCMSRAELRGTSKKKSKDIVRARRGLLLGSSLHLTLIALKLIGVDGGGFLLPGNGLWEVYPAMLAVPFATASSLLIHMLVCVAATR